MIQVTVSNEEPLLNFKLSELEALINLIDHNGKYSIPNGELSIVFVDSNMIKKLHKDFLNDDTVTDVITFPGDDFFKLAGELIICPHYAYSVCKNFGQTFSEELTLYIVHGCLHLSGLDDQSDDDIKTMRMAENFIIDLIKKNNMVPTLMFNKK